MDQPPLLSDEAIERAEVDALAANGWRLDEATRCTGQQGLREARNALARTLSRRPDTTNPREVAA